MSLLETGTARPGAERGDAVVRLDGVYKQYGHGANAQLALDRV